MRNKIKLFSEIFTFLFMGFALILFPFIANIFEEFFIDRARMIIFIIVGVFSIIFGVVKFVAKNEFSCNFLAVIKGIICFSLLIESISFFISGNGLLGTIIASFSISFFLLSTLFTLLKKFNKSNLLDDYLQFFISFAGFLLFIAYLICLAVRALDKNMVLALFEIVISILLGASIFANLAFKERENIKFDIKTLKESFAVAVPILFGLFSFYVIVLLYKNSEGLTMNFYKFGNFFVSFLSIVLGIILFLILRKGRKKDEFYYYETLLTCIAVSEFLVYAFRDNFNSIDVSVLWLIACLVPIVIYVIKFWLKDFIELPSWVEIIIVLLNLAFVLGVGISYTSGLVYTYNIDNRDFNGTIGLIFGLLMMLPALTYSVIHIFQVIKGEREFIS